jgi:hypothetical protein
MARVFKLTRTGLSDVNFLAAAASGMRAQKWAPAQAPISYREIPSYVAEEIDFLVDRDSDDNLAATMRALDEYAAMAEMWWHDRTIYTPVWFHVKMDGATYTRRALVKSLRYEWLSDLIADTGHAAAHDAVLRLFIERHPYWESLNQFTVATSADLAGASVVHDPSNVTDDGEIKGTVPARPLVAFRSSDAVAHLIDRLWMGIRSEKHGDPDNFLRIWECDDGALGTDAAVITPDATASDNARVEVDFATTPGWAKRNYMECHLLTANPEDQPGRFLELLRAKVDSGTTCEVYLKIGLDIAPADTYITIGPIRKITTTNWDYFEMGDAVIPVLNSQDGQFTELHPDNFPDQTVIEIWARRTGGSGSLHLDCLCPIPIDEGYAILSDIGSENNIFWSYYWQSERDESVTLSYASVVNRGAIVNDHNFRWPPGEVRLIIVWARDTQSDLTDTLDVDTAHFTRWASLRGSEGKFA